MTPAKAGTGHPEVDMGMVMLRKPEARFGVGILNEMIGIEVRVCKEQTWGNGRHWWAVSN